MSFIKKKDINSINKILSENTYKGIIFFVSDKNYSKYAKPLFSSLNLFAQNWLIIYLHIGNLCFCSAARGDDPEGPPGMYAGLLVFLCDSPTHTAPRHQPHSHQPATRSLLPGCALRPTAHTAPQPSAPQPHPNTRPYRTARPKRTHARTMHT